LKKILFATSLLFSNVFAADNHLNRTDVVSALHSGMRSGLAKGLGGGLFAVCIRTIIEAGKNPIPIVEKTEILPMIVRHFQIGLVSGLCEAGIGILQYCSNEIGQQHTPLPTVNKTKIFHMIAESLAISCVIYLYVISFNLLQYKMHEFGHSIKSSSIIAGSTIACAAVPLLVYLCWNFWGPQQATANAHT
jgi:hypothetical protein